MKPPTDNQIDRELEGMGYVVVRSTRKRRSEWLEEMIAELITLGAIAAIGFAVWAAWVTWMMP